MLLGLQTYLRAAFSTTHAHNQASQLLSHEPTPPRVRTLLLGKGVFKRWDPPRTVPRSLRDTPGLAVASPSAVRLSGYLSSSTKKKKKKKKKQVLGLLSLRTSPMQLPTQGQWWSNLRVQLSQIAQWEQRGGR